MDGRSFDHFARLLSVTGSRRQALLAVLGSALAGTTAIPAEAKGKRRRGAKAQRRDRAPGLRAEAIPGSCCSSGNCAPGPGKNLSKCCYEGQILAGKNFKGANLGSAVFLGATLTNANFAGANLGKTCLVDADLTRATINGSTNLGGTIFCRTTMPDGSVNNSGCGKGTACCPTCIPVGGDCGVGSGGSCCGDDCLNGICPCDNGMVDCDGDGVCEACGSCDAAPCPPDPETGEDGFCCTGGFCSCGGECCDDTDCFILTNQLRDSEQPPTSRELCERPASCVICGGRDDTCCTGCAPETEECFFSGPIGRATIRRR